MPRREKAEGARKARHGEGQNPIAERDRARRVAVGVPTFLQAANSYIASHEGGWRNPKHAAQWRMTIDRYCAPLHNIPANEIATADVLAVLTPIWSKIPETASRVRGRIEMIIDAARVSGSFDENLRNPAQWKGHLDKALKRKKTLVRGHHAAMPYGQLPPFLMRVRELDTFAALALEFTILTASRTGETIGSVWSEIDLKARTWTVPKERMKTGREHVVPLCARAVEILELLAQGRVSNFIFPGQKRGKPLSNMAMESVLRRLGVNEVATVHGMRSTFRDWCGDHTEFPREVAEAALAHVVGDKAEQAYRRSSAFNKRKDLMKTWGEFCSAS